MEGFTLMTDRTYIITGAASGIGAATSLLLKERGANVIEVDIHNCAVIADLSTVVGRASAIAHVKELSKGRIDAIIPCAGSVRANVQTVSVNFFGVTDFLTGLLPIVSQSLAPRVATISSVASLLPNSPELIDAMLAHDEPQALIIAQGLVDQGPELGGLIYASTKQALSRWIRRESIRQEWAGAGITLNAVAPGMVETPMIAKMVATPDSRAATDALIPMPLNYYLKPRQVAYLLAWLTGEENTHITGQTIYIDGGSDASIRGENIWG